MKEWALIIIGGIIVMYVVIVGFIWLFCWALERLGTQGIDFRNAGICRHCDKIFEDTFCPACGREADSFSREEERSREIIANLKKVKPL